ncbi:DUF2130 domain-containing protein [Bradyrhizobium sp. DASA03007]|uniref:DUF2130 domain-containing protein n=1 Tax=unclassified Bradyrhizobium TaxID=2631580 RepID=UPI003F72413C
MHHTRARPCLLVGFDPQRREPLLGLVRAQNIDIMQFESQLETFKTAFSKNYDLASRHFQTAIAEIDRSIDYLQKTKDTLIGADRNVRLASDKAQDVTIKKLTRGNPTMAAKFAELKSLPAEAAECDSQSSASVHVKSCNRIHEFQNLTPEEPKSG